MPGISSLAKATVAVCSFALLSGCMSILESVSFKLNVTKFRVEDSDANRAVTKNHVDSLAREFGFTDTTQQWRSRTGAKSDLIVGYVLDLDSRTHAPYTLMASCERAEPGFTFDGEILDLAAFAAKLHKPSPSDKVSMYLRSLLSTGTEKLLTNYGGGASVQLHNALATDLNNHVIFQKGSPYDAERFRSVELSAETLKLMEQQPEGRDLYCLNRMLLQDAYPRELKRMNKNLIVASIAHGNRTGTKTAKYLEIEQRMTAELRERFGERLHIETYIQWKP